MCSTVADQAILLLQVDFEGSEDKIVKSWLKEGLLRNVKQVRNLSRVPPKIRYQAANA